MNPDDFWSPWESTAAGVIVDADIETVVNDPGLAIHKAACDAA